MTHARLKTADAAEYTGISIHYLARLRTKGGGPRFIKVGRHLVLYDTRDLDRWLNDRKRDSTSASR
jgi:hypothetical protein